MTNAFGKDIDTTYLDPHTAAYRQVLHRDMAAHNFRWSYVCKFLRTKARHKTHNVLDVGCGRLVNLAKMMYHNMLTHTSGSYTGVDYGPIPWPETIKPDTKKFRMRLHEKTDFANWDPEDQPKKGGWDLITSFEVLEHVEPHHTYRILKRMRELVDRNGCAIISTPNYSLKVGAAKNHVNEMTYRALYSLIHAAGWKPSKVFGTFASQTDYKNFLTPDQLYFMQDLQEYYDSTAISLIMAPLIAPERARNCMWILQPDVIDSGPINDSAVASKDMSNSKKWAAARRKIIKELK